jgi:hypothetical protein
MKEFLIIMLLLFVTQCKAQNDVTFSIEKLSKPENLLLQHNSKTIYQDLIELDVNLEKFELEEGSIEIPYNILAQSVMPDSLVNYGYQSFFYGLYQAYADHRPFVISPDMIWLLISQGFARHITHNAEKLRHHFVDYNGKHSLVVITDTIDLNNPESPWENIFPKLTEQIAQFTGKELIETLSADFSTTTPTSKVASQITIMEAMEPYFEFVVIRIVCGIPEITLKGTTDDWQKLLDKTKQLAKYDLQWWTSELEPLLAEFIKASKGNVNKKFWRNIFKYHSQKKYGDPKIIDGWIVKFFPYDKKGKRNNLKNLKGGDDLPEEIVKVDLKFIDDNQKVTMLELWAGFLGLEQDKSNFALTSHIGWMIRKKDIKEQAFVSKLHYDNNSDWGGIDIRVKEIPAAIYELKKIKSINIKFIDKIDIPDKLAELNILQMSLSGEISEMEIQRIKKLFPHTLLYINNKEIK